jgi:antitoxin (DNA-binding transcriptional repressor) of toxin-antitoxin stability system
MARKAVTVSAFEAKTRLSELLRETERGATFVIERRGRAVAQLGPLQSPARVADFAAIAAAFREIRRRIPGRIRVRALIEQGRRW